MLLLQDPKRIFDLFKLHYFELLVNNILNKASVTRTHWIKLFGLRIEDRKLFSLARGVYIPEAVVGRQMVASPAPPSPPVTASTPASRTRRSLQRSLLSVAAAAAPARAVTSPPGAYSNSSSLI